MTTTLKVRLVVKHALRALAPTLKTLAQKLGVSHDLLRRYRFGDRDVPSTVRTRLARVLRDRAASLVKYAEQLERETDRTP